MIFIGLSMFLWPKFYGLWMVAWGLGLCSQTPETILWCITFPSRQVGTNVQFPEKCLKDYPCIVSWMITFRTAGQLVLPSCHLVLLSSLHVHTQKRSPVPFRSSALGYSFQGTQPKSTLCVPSCASYLLSIHSSLSFQFTSKKPIFEISFLLRF